MNNEAALEAATQGDRLVKNFLRGFRESKRSGHGQYLWAMVSEAFGTGSTVAVMVCRKHGFDPEMLVNQRRIG